MKLCLLALFFFYIEGPQLVYRIYESESLNQRSLSPIEELRLERAFDRYVGSLVDAAKKKVLAGSSYSPTDYFSDLKKIYEKRREMGVSPSYIMNRELASALDQLLRLESRKNNDELERAKADYKEFIDPTRLSREETFKTIRALGWKGNLKGLMSLYLTFLPFAFVLFLIWISENREDQQILFPRPGRFLLMLIFYPIAIGYIFIKWLQEKERHFRLESELRRTKQNLFTCLSEKEIQRIRQFRKSTLSIWAWRQQLATLGLRPRHSLVAALIATLLLGLTPNFLQAEGRENKKSFLSEVTLEYAMEQDDHLARMDIDSSSQNQQDDWVIISESHDLKTIILVGVFCFKEVRLRLKELCRQIDHVPLLGRSAEVR